MKKVNIHDNLSVNTNELSHGKDNATGHEEIGFGSPLGMRFVAATAKDSLGGSQRSNRQANQSIATNDTKQVVGNGTSRSTSRGLLAN